MATRVWGQGSLTSFVGPQGGSAGLSGPTSVTLDDAENLYVADSGVVSMLILGNLLFLFWCVVFVLSLTSNALFVSRQS
jgi:hypothetical protein